MEWSKDMAVGIETIDEQHRELFKRINDLLRAIKEHRCKSEIDGTINSLTTTRDSISTRKRIACRRPGIMAWRITGSTMPNI